MGHVADVEIQCLAGATRPFAGMRQRWVSSRPVDANEAALGDTRRECNRLPPGDWPTVINAQVELGIVALPAVQGHLRSGAMRAINVFGESRLASIPSYGQSPTKIFPKPTLLAASPSSTR